MPNLKRKLPMVSTTKTTKMKIPLINQRTANPVGGEAVHAAAEEAVEVAVVAAAVEEAEATIIVTTATQVPEAATVGAVEVEEEAVVAEINKITRIINGEVEAVVVAKAIEDDNKTKTSLN